MPTFCGQVIQSNIAQLKTNKQLSQGIFPEAEPEAGLWLHVFYKGGVVQERAIRE